MLLEKMRGLYARVARRINKTRITLLVPPVVRAAMEEMKLRPDDPLECVSIQGTQTHFIVLQEVRQGGCIYSFRDGRLIKLNLDHLDPNPPPSNRPKRALPFRLIEGGRP